MSGAFEVGGQPCLGRRRAVTYAPRTTGCFRGDCAARDLLLPAVSSCREYCCVAFNWR